ncbi:hypothetical protein MMC30_006145 [Trapelia coarctata]|nr:hypothetical protein [Trapelia coarctata]
MSVSELKSADDGESNRCIHASLAPPTDAPYGNDFHSQDLDDQLKYRHPGTCRWIFEHAEFQDWFRGGSVLQPALYIASGPGGGKSMLMASVIAHLQALKLPLFFFFKDTDRNKNTSIAAIKPLLNQVYNYGRQPEQMAFTSLENSLKVAD